MKNIHILPTDKPSKFAEVDGIFVFGKNLKSPVGHPTMYLYRHIYITSDEEIKEGDWIYIKTPNIYGGNIVTKCLGFGKDCWSEHILTDTTDEKGYHPSHCKKIILTTDQDLIKDGVQEIDNEFLEWFVKNPTCEYVEIKKGSYNLSPMEEMLEKEYVPKGTFDTYKIIVPKEEPEEHVECNMCGGSMHLLPDESIYVCTNSECTRCYEEPENQDEEEPKQETLEEAAERLFPVSPQKRKLWLEGVKWQANRMYSEEEVKMIAFSAMDFKAERIINFSDKVKWFEQFKKK